jgi:glycosyltransferase involved in cell wall biosynthesis
VAFLSNYVPRQCGIATFTFDLFTHYQRHLTATAARRQAFVVAVTDRPDAYEYPVEVKYDFPQQDLKAYRQAAVYLKERDVEVVCLQHEYGIFGGPAGEYLLTLLRELDMPIVTTLHTVLKNPDEAQRRVLRELARLSAKLVVMTERGRQFLETIYEVPAEKIEVIAHGIPDVPYAEDPSPFKEALGVAGRRTLLTFGLLSPNKGIEHVIRALPEVVQEVPDLLYLIVGATHPNLVRERGEEYRESLQKLARELGVEQHVQFHNKFLALNELTQYIQAADVYITPYLNPAQITSGTLAYCFGCGKAVVSTPYWHAEELLADDRGVLIPFADSGTTAQALRNLFRDDAHREHLRRQAYALGREMIWARVAEQYDALFCQVSQHRPLRSVRVAQRSAQTQALPPLRLDHLHRLTDSTGIIQHARYTLPFREEGYCTDDNARALILTTWLDGSDLILDARVPVLMDTYASFLNHAFLESTGRFRNFMSYGREWLEEMGSEDSHGRALWALGTLLAQTRRADLRAWAIERFDQAIGAIEATTSPRAWAYAMLGIHEYLNCLGGDRRMRALQTELAQRLVTLHRRTAQPHWFWFETKLTYDNARLCEALLASGDEEAMRLGVHTLEWLRDIQTSPEGHFQPIGNDGFYEFGKPRAQFDQQPLEAAAMVAAALRAHQFTGMEVWLKEAWKAFGWFTGRNDLGLSLYDEASAGCFDGLQTDRVNRNQGAESTLAYLMAWTELKLSLDRQTERVQRGKSPVVRLSESVR